MTTRTRGFTFYELLGIPETADSEAITRAFRRLAKLYHPDSNPDGGQQTSEMFKAISAAYETLRDEQLRASYDARLRAEREEPDGTGSWTADEPTTTSTGARGPVEESVFVSQTAMTPGELFRRLKDFNRRGRIEFWWSPSLIGFPCFAWLEARRITGDKRYTRLTVAYVVALVVIGTTGLVGLYAAYWLLGIAHVALRYRTVRA